MSKSRPRPNRCIEHSPTSQSVIFCDEFISIATISLMTGISPGGLSLIFSGKRQPSIRTAKKIADALYMGLEEFIKGLDDHIAVHAKYEKALLANPS